MLIIFTLILIIMIPIIIYFINFTRKHTNLSQLMSRTDIQLSTIGTHTKPHNDQDTYQVTKICVICGHMERAGSDVPCVDCGCPLTRKLSGSDADIHHSDLMAKWSTQFDCFVIKKDPFMLIKLQSMGLLKVLEINEEGAYEKETS